ncbi:MAG: hypothetical protein IKC14_03355 [Kiritimatiellae bacterium]|nr:hypothetical protein [Kiritimatiellia bacterium]
MSSGRNSIGAAGLLLAYSCMAFPDAIGVVAARLRLDGIASALVFAWFALFAIPSGLLCDRFGSRRVAVFALGGTLPAFALLAVCGDFRYAAAAGLAFAGAANVALQVSLPSRAVELFGVSRQASVLTLGLFAKTLFAMAIPFAIAAFAHAGDWRFFFSAYGVVFTAAAALMWIGGGESSCPLRGAASLAGVVEVARDVPTALSALSFAVGVIADVAFNLSVPDAVHLRFAMGDAAVGTVYIVLFGVKLPVTLLGAWFFARCDARRFFSASIAIAALGAFALIMAEGFVAYLAGVALFAAGYANVYGFVYAVAAPRHSSGKAASVAALLTMSIAGGALASPLIAAISCPRGRSAEALSAAATAALLLLASLATRLSRRFA